MYTKIEEQFWKDNKIIKLSFRARYLMMYLLTSPHRNILCYYFLPKPYACFDLGFSEEEFDLAMGELIAAERVFYDEKANVVFVKNYLKYNQLENQNQVKSAVGKIIDIPENDLVNDFIKNLKSLNKAIYETLINGILKRFNKPLPKPLPKPLQEGLAKPDNREQITDNNISTTTTAHEEEIDSQEKDDIAVDDDLAEVYQVFQDNIQPIAGQIMADQIQDMLTTYGKLWLIEAIKRAVKRGARNIGYIEGILKKWKAGGGIDDGEGGKNDGKQQHSRENKKSDEPIWDNFYANAKET